MNCGLLNILELLFHKLSVHAWLTCWKFCTPLKLKIVLQKFNCFFSYADATPLEIGSSHSSLEEVRPLEDKAMVLFKSAQPSVACAKICHSHFQGCLVFLGSKMGPIIRKLALRAPLNHKK